ncbi:hypothetical protein AX17_006780 [Amanita inopinata Kibby_2008]|nr:hypothetical protein AX17_006780 [Amanita inopinata Kibby_2008]
MSPTAQSPALASLQTESRNSRSYDIDIVSTVEMCRIMNDADSGIASAVGSCIDVIAPIIDEIAQRVRQNGRVIYVGAGTSGRLGILDASEIPPTFSAPYSQFIGLMAGGDSAIRRAVEGAEDSLTQPIEDLSMIQPPLTHLDTLIGIAASGRTPYVLSGLSYAKDSLRMLTVGVACVKPSQMRNHCEHIIECVVGAEIITGSTRMKAGTATKLILNMISTGVMIRIGKTYGNMMVDLKTSNLKLVDRSRRILRTLHPSTTLNDGEIDQLISSCNGSVKLALVVAKLGCSVEEGVAKLDAAGGVLKKAWQAETTSGPVSNNSSIDSSLVLCIDAGGTKCSVAIANKSGVVTRAVGGSCNFATMGHDHALSVLKDVINDALAKIRLSHSKAPGVYSLSSGKSLFNAAWIGGAGLDHEADLVSIRPKITELLRLPDPSKLHITNDAALLSSAILTDNEHDSSSDIKTCIVLITGTGSIAYSYRLPFDHGPPIPVPIERSGGWGYLLGDEASAYHIGKTAIQKALGARDLGLPPTPLHLAIVNHLGCSSVKDILSSVYRSSQTSMPSSVKSVDTDPKLRIASLSPVILGQAFPSGGAAGDKEAVEIVRHAAACGADLIMPLLRRDGPVKTSHSVLILGGALAQVAGYRELIFDTLRERDQVFARVEVVEDVASYAVRLLIKSYLE